MFEFGFTVPLKNRIYPEGEPIPVDHENFCNVMNAVYSSSL